MRYDIKDRDQFYNLPLLLFFDVMWGSFIYLLLFFLEGGMVFLGEGGDCGEFLFFHFFVFNFYQFTVLTLFLIF